VTPGTRSADGRDDRDLSAVRDVVERVVGAFAPVPLTRSRPDQVLIDDLGYDSFRLLELIFALEELFDIEPLGMTEVPVLGTAGELSRYVADQVRAGDATPPDEQTVERALTERQRSLEDPEE
jgi:acyl carrier protein